MAFILSATRPALPMFCAIEARFIHDDAIFEKQNPVGIGGDARVVRHHHHRAAPFVRHLPQQRGDLVRRLGIRLPVGSSARVNFGSATSARATATRCCWPPDSWSGRLFNIA